MPLHSKVGLTPFGGEAKIFAVVPVGIKRERGACAHNDARNAAAAPATVSGECSACSATGSDASGKAAEARTREPGDLPPATVTRERVGRGVLTNLVRLLHGPLWGEGGPPISQIAVTGTLFASGASRVSCQLSGP
jgi:hypothetical protein